MTEISISIPASAQPSGKAVFVMLGTGFDEIEALAPSMSCDVPGWRFSPSP